MGIVRGQVERVEVVGLDEAYLDISGLYSPRAAMRRLVHEIREATGIVCSVGIGPNKLVAKVASDAEKPAGFVVLSREQACARFGGSPRASYPGSAPRPRRAWRSSASPRSLPLRAAPETVLVERFGPNLGRELRRRARFEHDGEVGAARKVVSESRERTFDHDLHDPAQLSALLERMSAELCASLATHGRSGRTIGIKVRLDDFTTVTRAHTLAEPTADPQVVDSVAQRLLREYAPPRPVRLLGVRVAGLISSGPTTRTSWGARARPRRPDDQLALPV